jgi:spermidine/putrescine transport system permease protein
VRQGTTPAISALAVVIIAISVTGAIVYEVLRRAEERRETTRARAAREAERVEAAAQAA